MHISNILSDVFFLTLNLLLNSIINRLLIKGKRRKRLVPTRENTNMQVSTYDKMIMVTEGSDKIYFFKIVKERNRDCRIIILFLF